MFLALSATLLGFSPPALIEWMQENWSRVDETLGANLVNLVGYGLVGLLTLAGIWGVGASLRGIQREEQDMKNWRAFQNAARSNHPQDAPVQILRTTFKERDRQKNSEKSAPSGGGESNANKDSIAQDIVETLNGYPSLSLLEERLLLISSMVKGNNKIRIMPHISELHDLSLQRIESERPSKVLNVCTTIILVCGICGTLWSVHYQIGHMEANSANIGTLADCLWPSAVAVIANVLLIIMRHVIAAMLDQHLVRLDEITLSLFVPALQPDTDVEQMRVNFLNESKKLQNDARLNFYAEFPLAISSATRHLSKVTQDLLEELQILAQRSRQLFHALREMMECMKGLANAILHLARQANRLPLATRGLSLSAMSMGDSLRRLVPCLPEGDAVRDASESQLKTSRDAGEATLRFSELLGKLQEWNSASQDLLRLCAQLGGILGGACGEMKNLEMQAQTLRDSLQAASTNARQLFISGGMYSPAHVAIELQQAAARAKQAAGALSANIAPLTEQVKDDMAQLTEAGKKAKGGLQRPLGILERALADFNDKGDKYLHLVRWSVVIPFALILVVLALLLYYIGYDFIWLPLFGN